MGVQSPPQTVAERSKQRRRVRTVLVRGHRASKEYLCHLQLKTNQGDQSLLRVDVLLVLLTHTQPLKLLHSENQHLSRDIASS